MKAFFQDKKQSRINRFESLDYAPHLHNAPELGILLKGKSVLRLEGKAYSLSAGDLFAVFPGQIHSFEESCDAEGYLGIFTPEDIAPFQTTLSEMMPKAPVLSRERWEKESLETLFSLACEDGNRVSADVNKGYYRVILGKILPLYSLEKREKGKESALREILHYLAAHSTENLNRKSLARAVGVSESTVSHIFSETFRTSLPNYLNSLRLAQAQSLLKETKLGVTQVASNAGFGSLRSFNRAFRKEFAMSPSEYRKQNS